ncbi:MAG: NAD(P)-binding domain-containing protein [Chloroflexota bacterium]|nr:NAD(P)-binding domain-containing protein [Chloroflexota bacterium]
MNVGFIGLGQMGGHMTRNLAKAGRQVVAAVSEVLKHRPRWPRLKIPAGVTLYFVRSSSCWGELLS